MYVNTISEVINSRFGAPYQHHGEGGSFFLVAAELIGRTIVRHGAPEQRPEIENQDGCIALIAVVHECSLLSLRITPLELRVRHA